MLVLAMKPLQKLIGTDRRVGRQADRQAYLRVGRLCLQKSSINESTTTKQYQNDQIATSSLWTSCLQQTDGDKQM